MNGGMFSSQFCQHAAEAVDEQQRRPVAAGVDVVDHRGRRPRTARCIDGQSTPIHGGRRRRRRSRRPGRAWRSDRRGAAVARRHSALRYRRPMRIAIDIDSTLHHYWDQFAAIAKRRFGVDLPYEHAAHLGDHAAAARAGPRLRRGDATREQHVLAAEPYPGAVEAIRALARGRATSSTSPRTAHRGPRRDRALARADRAALRRALLLVRQGRAAACELEIDVLIDDSPVNLLRAAEAGITRRHDHAPVEPRPVRGGGHRVRARTGRRSPQRAGAGARVSEHRALPAPDRRATRGRCCPRSSPTARSPTGAARSASRGCSTRTLYEFLYHYWFRCRGRGDRERPVRPAAPCSSPTTPARCRPTRR